MEVKRLSSKKEKSNLCNIKNKSTKSLFEILGKGGNITIHYIPSINEFQVKIDGLFVKTEKQGEFLNLYATGNSVKQALINYNIVLSKSILIFNENDNKYYKFENGIFKKIIIFQFKKYKGGLSNSGISIKSTG